MLQEKICLWHGRALFIGNLPPLDYHEQSAILYCVGLEHDFTLTYKNGRPSRQRAARIPPKTSHALDVSGGRAAFLFLDPEWDDGAPDKVEHEKACSELLKIDLACSDLELQTALENLTLGGATLSCDERMQNVVAQILGADDGSLALEELALNTGLSVSRLQHLFKEQVGVPIRSFKIWHRLKKAVRLLKDGKSLTDAALLAGFYDSSHFANTFRENFGIPPSTIFAGSKQLVWFVD